MWWSGIAGAVVGFLCKALLDYILIKAEKKEKCKAILEELNDLANEIIEDRSLLSGEPIVGKAAIPSSKNALVFLEDYSKVYLEFTKFEREYIRRSHFTLSEYNRACELLVDQNDIRLVFEMRDYALRKGDVFCALVRSFDKPILSSVPRKIEISKTTQTLQMELKSKYEQYCESRSLAGLDD